MNPLSRARAAVVAACLLGLAVAARADDKPVDSKALDRYVFTSLRFVINHGVDLYNRFPEDPRGPEKCYQHFRQSLEELAPVLSNHPDLQKEIKESLEKVEKDPDWRAKMAAKAQMPNPQAVPPGEAVRVKAFALRAVFNDVRGGLSPAEKKPVPPKKEVVEGGKAEAPRGDVGTVKGRVALGGKPLATGKITLTGQGGKAVSDTLEPDGSFALENVPAGAYKVTITDNKAVPAKYADTSATPLTLNVTKGANTHDIALTE